MTPFAEWFDSADGPEYHLGTSALIWASKGFDGGVAWQRDNEDFDHLLETARRILDGHYPRDSVVCSHEVPDVGARFTASLRDLIDEVDAVIAKRPK